MTHGFFKLALVLLAVGMLLPESAATAETRFLKKLSVEPLVNPRDWQEPFRPGSAIALMLGDALSASGEFQMVRPGPKFRKRRTTRAMKGSETLLPEAIMATPISQYRIGGRVMVFEPETDPPPEDRTQKEALRHREHAEVEVVIDLVNVRTGRSFVKKTFRVTAQEGRTPFDPEKNYLDYEAREFGRSSMGRALQKLALQMQSFIAEVLMDVPLEGNLIRVDKKSQSVLIDLGEANAVQVQDVFTVFSLEPGFTDPLNQADLGDKLTRQGIVKVVEVQDRFAKARITAGLDLTAGDLVVPKTRVRLKKKEKRVQNGDIIWGAFKGFPAISY
ncbi:MAG: hypothetical protein IID18_06835 [Nitrospinae bacterium]|nr:hypothetical protein [Nitrospinota bacterium]